MKSDVIVEIVQRLIGSTSFYGETDHDKEAVANINNIGEVICTLLDGLFREYKGLLNRSEWSAIEIRNTLKRVSEDIRCYLIDEEIKEDKQMDNKDLQQELVNIMYSIRSDWSSDVRSRMNRCIEIAEMIGEIELKQELEDNFENAMVDGRTLRDMKYNYNHLCESWGLELEDNV